jgi:hypothetical protein
MHPTVSGVLWTQHQLITRQQALASGMTEAQLRSLTRSGAWVTVRRGVYAPAEEWARLDEHLGRPRLRARAAHLMMVEPHAFSHTTAARELGLSVLTPHPDLVHITRPGVRGSRTEHGVKHHGAVHREDQVVVVDGLQVLDAARTAVDIAREHGIAHGVPACDSALRSGVARTELVAACAPMANWPGVTAARASIELADEGAESVGESLARLLVHELGLGRPQTQFVIRDQHRWARCDLRVGRHLFEFDGKIKYQRRDAGGVADRPAEEVVWLEKQRQDWICGYELGMSRIIWADLWGENRRRALRRLAREYAATAARFGTSIDDLRGVVVTDRAS